MLDHVEILEQALGLGNSGPVRYAVKRLRHTLGEDQESPARSFTALRFGYRMAKGETLGTR